MFEKKEGKLIKAYKLPIDKRKVLIITSCTFTFFIFFISLILLANYTYFWNRFYLNTKVGDEYIGGMTLGEATNLFNEKIANFQDELVEVKINDQTIEIEVRSFQIEISAKDALNEIFSEQHPDYTNQFEEFIYSSLKHFSKYNQNLSSEINEDALLGTIYSNFENINPLREPEISYTNGVFTIVEGQIGNIISDTSIEALRSGFADLDLASYTLEIVQNSPTLSDAEVEKVAEEANKLLEKELILKAGEFTLKEKLSDHPEWLAFEFSIEEKLNAFYSQPIYYKFGNGIVAGESTEPVSYCILLDPEKVSKYVNEEIVNKLEGHSENIILSLNSNGKISVEGTLKDGYALEKEEAVSAIVENFKKGIYETDLPISIQKGEIIDNTGQNLGIKELIGFGESDFGYSNTNRETNIKIGLSRFQNVIIGPGEVFNYADYIGPIDAEHGFLPGWVIKNGTQSALEYGGGICQTSTTLFRAAFYAGFPILERHPHGYDVSYYRWPAVGLDASVYVPYASMKFKNDSPAHILIQQSVNTETKRAKVWIYGTSDNRKVEVSGPDVYGKYWASTSIETPSSNVVSGEKVLSHAAIAGFQSDWYRKVIYSDGRIENYTVHSSYAAVPATYLVGQ